ncbi:MAG: hypothetical protein NDJ19_07735 [Ramlibacter sp.]|nr:hypothetical protein [Ramlibacter sp.]
MLRLTVLLLMLANAAFFGWSQGLLAPWGLAPAQQSEPQRLRQQIRPQALRILGGDEARRADAAAPPGTRAQECLQAGVFEEAQVAMLKRALESWPAGSWVLEPAIEPRGWTLRFPAVDDSLRPRLQDLQAALGARTLRPCR